MLKTCPSRDKDLLNDSCNFKVGMLKITENKALKFILTERDELLLCQIYMYMIYLTSKLAYSVIEMQEEF